MGEIVAIIALPLGAVMGLLFGIGTTLNLIVKSNHIGKSKDKEKENWEHGHVAMVEAKSDFFKQILFFND